MELHIFRTDIKTKKKVKSLKSTLNKHSDIIRWSVDLEDIDNVLKIEAEDSLAEAKVIDLVKAEGFYINPLAE